MEFVFAGRPLKVDVILKFHLVGIFLFPLVMFDPKPFWRLSSVKAENTWRMSRKTRAPTLYPTLS